MSVTKMSLILLGISLIFLQAESRCRHVKKKGSLRADCFNQGLKRIPEDLIKDIEILDARHNTIPQLVNDSIKWYPFLKEIYLQTTGLLIIDHTTFSSSTQLEILDLSNNLIRDLPQNIFYLPKLRKLYLDHNEITDTSFKSLNVTSPIEYLDLSVNKLTRVPQLSLFHVVLLNLTGNPIKTIKVEELATMCSLKELIVNEDIFNDSGCSCHIIEKLLSKWNIKVTVTTPLNCQGQNGCTNVDMLFDHTLALREKCETKLLAQKKIRQREAKMIYWSIAVGLAVFMLALVLSFWFQNRKSGTYETKEVMPTSDYMEELSDM
ncbi:podocan-like [Copidosoma floridanum]|uniref:podocan-like n=1 Tax=Copidosoma floridanum TaxID=29053 RepID=UPI0006C978B9|nr:podocan-like [Copidosoma floridanum]XP_023246699.1 podocan-like [Copidosoma floridanum]